MTDGVRRRTVLTTALGAVPIAMAGGLGGADTAWAAPGTDRSEVTGLTVEHRTDPLGVDAERPRFGWRTDSAVRGRRQLGYRIRVAGSHLSPYGEIVSAWTVRDGTLHYRAAVPANTTATLRIPAAGPDAVREGRTPLSRVSGVEFAGFADGTANYRLPSGRYELTAAQG
ncbi:alpha-L-rhamnosidase C-terminal domain-containing protein [Streptomyces shenzhenensis]|uniref:glycoside hydrolase family 78 protein n=1 Tax=Streptomyces shenzhenensis TaxID=943815 RepID=UPI0038305B35